MLIISHASSRNKLASGGFRPTVISSFSGRRQTSLHRRFRAVAAALLVVLSILGARSVEAQQVQWPRSLETDTTAVSLGFLRMSRVFPFSLPGAPALDQYFLRAPSTSWVSTWENRLRSTLEQERFAFLRPAWANVQGNREII